MIDDLETRFSKFSGKAEDPEPAKVFDFTLSIPPKFLAL